MEQTTNRSMVEIDSNHRLMQVFNFINQDKTSKVFVYEGVEFWREESEFVMAFNQEKFYAGDVLDFDEFKEMLISQKSDE